MAEGKGPLMMSIPQTDASDKPFVTSSALDLSHVCASGERAINCSLLFSIRIFSLLISIKQRVENKDQRSNFLPFQSEKLG